MDQPLRHGMMTTQNSQQQRRPATACTGIGRATAPKQEIDKLDMPMPCGQMQRRKPVPVGHISASTTRHQPFGLKQIAALGRFMQKTTALRITDQGPSRGAEQMRKNGNVILHDKTRRPQGHE